MDVRQHWTYSSKVKSPMFHSAISFEAAAGNLAWVMGMQRQCQVPLRPHADITALIVCKQAANNIALAVLQQYDRTMRESMLHLRAYNLIPSHLMGVQIFTCSSGLQLLLIVKNTLRAADIYTHG